jgi:hypothetical protein
VPVLATVLVFVLAAATRSSAQNTTSNGTLRLQTDAPARNTAVVEPFLVGGWALDTQATSGTGIDAVRVWAVPPVGAPVFLGAATLGGDRPDVGGIFGPQFQPSGFYLTVTTLLKPGQ